MQTKRKTSISETINKTQKIITNIHETQSTKNDEQYKQQKKTTTHKTHAKTINNEKKHRNRKTKNDEQKVKHQYLPNKKQNHETRKRKNANNKQHKRVKNT